MAKGNFTGQGYASVPGKYDDIHSSKVVPLGTRVKDEDGNEFIFLEGVASTAQFDWVTYDELFATTRIAANAVGPVAVAQAALVANKYGWYQIFGKTSAKAGTVADNGKVYISGAATCDDAVVAGDQIAGAIWRSADSGGLATVQLAYPQATDALG